MFATGACLGGDAVKSAPDHKTMLDIHCVISCLPYDVTLDMPYHPHKKHITNLAGLGDFVSISRKPPIFFILGHPLGAAGGFLGGNDVGRRRRPEVHRRLKASPSTPKIFLFTGNRFLSITPTTTQAQSLSTPPNSTHHKTCLKPSSVSTASVALVESSFAMRMLPHLTPRQGMC